MLKNVWFLQFFKTLTVAYLVLLAVCVNLQDLSSRVTICISFCFRKNRGLWLTLQDALHWRLTFEERKYSAKAACATGGAGRLRRLMLAPPVAHAECLHVGQDKS